MNTIPEGKEQIYVEATYKEPIEGVPFSNVGLTVAISKYIEQGMEAKEIDKQIQRLTEEYFNKLKEDIREKADSIKETRNESIDKLRVELSQEYDEKLKRAKEIILEQREEIKLLKSKQDGNYNIKKVS